MQEQLQSFRRHLRLAFVTPILLAGLVGGVFVAQTYYLRSSFREVEHSYRTQDLTRSVLNLILDMETGLRGYLLTGEDRFLEPYRASEPQVQRALDELFTLVRSDSDEYRALIRTRTYYSKWYDYSQRMIAAKEQARPVDDFRNNLEGKQLVDFIRRDCDEILRREQDRARGRMGNVNRAINLILVTTVGVSLILGLLLAMFSRRELSVALHSYDDALLTAEARTQEFQESQRWLGAVVEGIGDGVIVTENTGRIVFTNAVAKGLLGDGKQLFAGKQSREVIKLVDETTLEPLRDAYQEVMNTGATLLPAGRAVLLRQDGGAIPVSEVASPLRDPSGRPTGVVIVLRDLTQQRLSERALQSSDKLAIMGRLAASVAHEIHNPLDALGNLLYLLQHQVMDESAKTYLRLAQEELERVTSISEQMLTFSREARQPIKVNLGEIVDNVLTLFMPRIRRMGIVLIKQYRPNDGIVVALPGEMRQVISNLVGNAMDAMSGGGRLVIRISDSLSRLGRGVRVLVCDTGPGIPPEVRQSLMEPFVTSKGEKGTGLGLWVCRGIVEKYHGAIRFRTSSRPGTNGTCFSVFLPVAATGESAASNDRVEHKAG